MRERRVGIRELKSKFGARVRDVKRGATIVVTEHGRKVARIVRVRGKRTVAGILVENRG